MCYALYKNCGITVLSLIGQIRVKRDQLQPKEPQHIPQVNDLMKDLSDGCCLATIIHHYYPHLLSLEGKIALDTFGRKIFLHFYNFMKGGKKGGGGRGLQNGAWLSPYAQFYNTH